MRYDLFQQLQWNTAACWMENCVAEALAGNIFADQIIGAAMADDHVLRRVSRTRFNSGSRHVGAYLYLQKEHCRVRRESDRSRTCALRWYYCYAVVRVWSLITAEAVVVPQKDERPKQHNVIRLRGAECNINNAENRSWALPCRNFRYHSLHYGLGQRQDAIELWKQNVCRWKTDEIKNCKQSVSSLCNR